MADILGGFGSAFNIGQNIAQSGFDAERRNRLAELASQAYSTPTGERNALLGQMAAVDPASAQAQEQAFATGDDRRNKTLVNMAKLLTSAPEQYREGIYQRMKPSLGSLGLSQVPDIYTPEVGALAEQLVSAWGGMDGSAAPSGWREFELMAEAAGLKPGTPEYKKAAGVHLGTVGRASSAGYGFDTIEWGGRTVPTRTDPRTGTQELWDGSRWIPLGSATNQGAPVATESSGMPVVFDNPEAIPPQVRAAIQQDPDAFARGRPINIGPQAPSAPSGIGVSRTPEAEAGAVTAAEVAARERAEAQARELYGSDSARDAQRDAAKKLPQLNEVIRLTGRISEALNDLNGAFINTGPADQYLQRFTEDGQSLSSSADAIQNSMLALTRVPGVGSQSDLEQRVAQMKYPQLGLHPSVNKDRMEDLQAFVRDLEAAYQNLLSGGSPGAAINLGGAPTPQQPAQSGGWAIEVVD